CSLFHIFSVDCLCACHYIFTSHHFKGVAICRLFDLSLLRQIRGDDLGMVVRTARRNAMDADTADCAWENLGDADTRRDRALAIKACLDSLKTDARRKGWLPTVARPSCDTRKPSEHAEIVGPPRGEGRRRPTGF
ncbi:hypothetical protein JZU48_00130, partial [bacterium]|nr:hypothetical protein [bacterium]